MTSIVPEFAGGTRVARVWSVEEFYVIIEGFVCLELGCYSLIFFAVFRDFFT